MRTGRLFLPLLLATAVACGGGKSKPDTTPTQPTDTSGAGTGTRPVSGDDAPLPLWNAVKKGKLANGLTYYVMNHKVPEKRAFCARSQRGQRAGG